MELFQGLSGYLDFAKYINLTEDEIQIRHSLLNESYMPFKVTKHYANLIKSKSGKPKEQLLNIVLPFIGEKHFIGRFDPYGNVTTRSGSDIYIQHKYEKTLLLHMYDYCIANCQFCYKVNEIRHEKKNEIGFQDKIKTAIDYLKINPLIDNILFSGGDPAAMPSNVLIRCLESLIMQDNIRIVRFATKVLAYNPKYFLDSKLVEFLKYINSKPGKQITIIAQINHPDEIDNELANVLASLMDAHVQVRGQPAIIRGVNDDVETLIELQRKFIDNCIIPYYFTAFMPVRGVEQYGLKLHESFRLMVESKRRLSGLEKQCIFLTSHDFGKFEICGFLPSLSNPDRIILRWHQAAMKKHLPNELVNQIPCEPGDILELKYDDQGIYCIDHLFCYNGIPYYNDNNILIDQYES